MWNRATAVIAVAALICLVPVAGHALTPYIQNFEELVIDDPDALANDGWLVYGNVYTPGGDFIYGYGAFPAPNHPLAFCAIVTGEGGPEQGEQQLVVFSDYENGDHGNGNTIEANVYQEQNIGPEDINQTWTFVFNAKMGNLEGGSTAAAFIKTLDPSAGYEMTNFIPADMTNIPETWGGYKLHIEISPDLEGQILQFGFMNNATNYEGSGIFYDNVEFYLAANDAPIGSAVNSMLLHQNYPNPFNPKTRIEFIMEQPGNAEVYVFDLGGRKIATLHQGELGAGEHSVTWNGIDERGHHAAAGQYWYVLRTPTGQVSRSMTLLK